MPDQRFVLRKLGAQGASRPLRDHPAVVSSFDLVGLRVRAQRLGLEPGSGDHYHDAEGARYVPDVAREDDEVVVAVMTAYDWHGGGGSPLYRFASWGGLVFSEGHRTELVREIDQVVAEADSDERARLGILRQFIVGATLCPPSGQMERLDQFEEEERS